MLLLLGMRFVAGCGADVAVTQRTFDNDGDGYTSEVDCDDSHAAVNPDAAEICGVSHPSLFPQFDPT